VRELSAGKQIRFSDCGPVQLKGLPEPTAVYQVVWRDAT
jgi:class 3 adenylate cyclase